MSFNAYLFEQKATNILNNAIKSVIYIDENAWEPFSKPSTNRSIETTETKQLSQELYRHFQKNKISLTLHRFKNIKNTIPYLSSEDLVLLDWHLEGEISGGVLALKLLGEIVKFDHITFCCIYTKSKSLNNIINNCISYFSGQNGKFYQSINEEFEYEDEFKEFISPYLNRIIGLPNIWDEKAIDEIKKEITCNQEATTLITRANSLQEIKKIQDKLRHLALAFATDLIKSNEITTPKIALLDKSKFVFSINKTIVLVMEKDIVNDKNSLFNKIRSELITKPNSFLLILGLELQNKLRNSCPFISEDIINVKNETIAYHWNNNIKSNNDPQFKEFVKQVMVDQVYFNIKKNDFELLENNLLNKKIKKPTANEIARINTFYNGIQFKGDRLISFGDIFCSQSNDNEYFLCITALCDCLYPAENIKYNYTFVRGQRFQNVDEAFKLGDESFISYLDEQTCISWIGLNDETVIDNYKPVYVKPIQLHVPTFIKENNITVHDWKDGKSRSYKLTYKFSLRSNYTQRIANHAFSHPLRVGIDFLKIVK
jgi:hypothetical protein